MSNKDQLDLSILCGAQSWLYLYISEDNNTVDSQKLVGLLTAHGTAEEVVTDILMEFSQKEEMLG